MGFCAKICHHNSRSIKHAFIANEISAEEHGDGIGAGEVEVSAIKLYMCEHHYSRKKARLILLGERMKGM